MHKSLTIEQREDFVYPRTTGPHSHSLFLQVWYELGLVGAALAALAGAATALRTTSLSPEVQPFAAATFAAYGASVALFRDLADLVALRDLSYAAVPADRGARGH